MSPASYRTAPPRVGEFRLRDRSRLLQIVPGDLGHVTHRGTPRYPYDGAHRASRERGTRGHVAGKAAGGAFGSVLLGPAEQSPAPAAGAHPGAAHGPAGRHEPDRRGHRLRALHPGHPQPAADQGTVLALAIGVPVYVGVAIFVGTVWGTAGALRALRWAIEDREPSDEERLKALGVPWFLTQIQAGLWLGGTVAVHALGCRRCSPSARSPPPSRWASPPSSSAASPTCSASSRCARSPHEHCPARTGSASRASAYAAGCCSSGRSAPAPRGRPRSSWRS